MCFTVIIINASMKLHCSNVLSRYFSHDLNALITLDKMRMLFFCNVTFYFIVLEYEKICGSHRDYSTSSVIPTPLDNYSLLTIFNG